MERQVFGTVPSVAIQQHLEEPDGVSWGAAPLAIVYMSHFVTPPAYWAWLWFRDRESWAKWNREFVFLTAAGVLTYVLVPAAPPWVASQDGYIGSVRRLAPVALEKLRWRRAAYWLARGQSGFNQDAALPSMHAAYSLLIAWDLAVGAPNAARAMLALYPAAMALSLVALGEHYVVDVALGYLYVGVTKIIVG